MFVSFNYSHALRSQNGNAPASPWNTSGTFRLLVLESSSLVLFLRGERHFLPDRCNWLEALENFDNSRTPLLLHLRWYAFQPPKAVPTGWEFESPSTLCALGHNFHRSLTNGLASTIIKLEVVLFGWPRCIMACLSWALQRRGLVVSPAGSERYTSISSAIFFFTNPDIWLWQAFGSRN
jgi:hypothetical protein